MDNCPERVDAADLEAVEFCPRMAVESMETEVDSCPERMHLATLYRF